MIEVNSTVVINEGLNSDCWRMVIQASRIASQARPGQFINVKVGEPNDPLFRRPFTIFRCCDLNEGTQGIEIIYKVVGRGTRVMAGLKNGDELDIIGPLGHGFELNFDRKTHVILAGGIGASALFMLGEELSKDVERYGLELIVLLGARTKEHLVLKERFERLNGKLLVSTDDGTYGYQGLATDMLRDNIENGHISSHCAIYACGPEPMTKVLQQICQRYSIPAQVSIEKHMMCGIGACLTCVCRVDSSRTSKHRDLKSSYMQFISGEELGYALVCKDGPVFYIDEVIFDD